MRRLLILLILCLVASSVHAQSGVALDAWNKAVILPSTTATNILFVEQTRGNDTYNGLSVGRPFKTLTAALAAASSGDTVRVLDSATYAESFVVPPNITLEAYRATVTGAVTISEGSRFYVDKHLASANSQTMLTKTGPNHGYYQATNSWYNNFSGVTNIENASSSSILFTRVTYMRVSGVGVRDLAPMTGQGGHIHFEIMDLYLEADNAIGIDAGNDDSDLIGRIDHIKFRSPAATGLVGIKVENDAFVELVVGDIHLPGNTVYEVIGAGSLYLTCMKMTGTKIGSAVEALSTSSGYTRLQIDSALSQTLANALAGTKLLYCGTDTVLIDGLDYGLLEEDPPITAQTIQTAVVNQTTYTQFAGAPGFVTAELGVTSLPSGQWQLALFLENNQIGGRNAEVRVQGFRVDSSNVKVGTALTTGTVIAEALGAGVVQRRLIDMSSAGNVMDLTDKILLEISYRRVGVTGGTDPTITTYAGGEYSGYLSFGLPGEVMMLTDGSNAVLPDARNNLGLGTMAVEAKTDYVATDTFTGHTGATGTSVHGLGTMAVETATDYVATDTFTGHTGATGTSVHGLGTMAVETATDYVATDTYTTGMSGKMDTDGSNADNPVFENMTATGTFKIPLTAPATPEDGMIWFE